MIPPWSNLAHAPLIIAEIGVNHNGNLDLALDLIAASKSAGVDVVKFQTYRTDLVVSRNAKAAPYQQERVGADGQAEMLRSYEFEEAQWRELARAAADAGLGFMSTAFDPLSLQLVDSLDPVAHKVPSGELTNTRFLRQLRDLGRPVIVSTGMATTAEIAEAVAVLSPEVPVALLHCLTSYPAPVEELNLRSIPFLRERFELPVGWSDHTSDDISGIAAVALDASIIERHITLDTSMTGPDHAASADPHQFRVYVEALRRVASAMGEHTKQRARCEEANVQAARRSWHATVDLEAGHQIAEDDLVALRPEIGVGCNVSIIGRVMTRAVPAGQPLMPECLADVDDDHTVGARP